MGAGPDGPSDSSKQVNGHAFVLLAAFSAKVAGHRDADRLITDITIIMERSGEEQFGAVAEEFTRDWHIFDYYRGQISTMPLTKSLMAAFEATNDWTYLLIADFTVGRRRHAATNGWQISKRFSKYPPAKPGAFECGPLEAEGGVADAAP